MMKFLEKEWKGRLYSLFALRDRDSLWIHFQGRTWLWKSQETEKTSRQPAVRKKGLISSPLPGRVQKVFVKKGDKLKRGQTLLTLSAMKMEYSFKAEGAGIVEEIFLPPGQTAKADQKLIKIKYF